MSLKSRLSGLVKAALHFALSMLDLAQDKNASFLFISLYQARSFAFYLCSIVNCGSNAHLTHENRNTYPRAELIHLISK